MITIIFRRAAICILAGFCLQSPAAEVIRGPVWSGTIRDVGRGGPDAVIAMKGIAVTLGKETNAFVCFDTDLLRYSLGWTGQFLDFGNTLTQIQWPPPPQVRGTPSFRTRVEPGWANGVNLMDPRMNHLGPLPRAWAHYRGYYLHGDEVILSYTVGTVGVLDSPGLRVEGDQKIFTRRFTIEKTEVPLTVLIAYLEGGAGSVNAPDKTDPAQEQVGSAAEHIAIVQGGRGSNAVAVGSAGMPAGFGWQIGNGRILLKIPAMAQSTSFEVSIWGGPAADLPKVAGLLNRKAEMVDLGSLCKGGPAHWTEKITTVGTLGKSDGPYAVDVLTEPVGNPYNIKTFFGGVDFFPDGRAALCTFHGDVWVVSGIDSELKQLTWKRYATGLFQALGLKVVDGTIYVLGRDQITRLHDLNGDGEADFYENFNNDCMVTPNYHEFALDLQTDSQGNFFYCKGAPWPPQVTSPHQGTVLKVSKDGSNMEIYASGLRAPNGMTIGPRDVILVGDNQGHWMPSSKLNLVTRRGFYGMMPAAQRELTLMKDGVETKVNPSDPGARGNLPLWDAAAPIPTGYDQPIAWVPYGVDNSSGGQVFVSGDKWGPFKGDALFESYGKCTLFHVMMEEVDGVAQAGMVQFPLKFDSGIMRARFNEKDGQLYVCGLRGWQTSASRDGGFYRVRYTGQPVHMPHDYATHRNGLKITFTSALNAASATSADNWTAEQWNILYSGNYGSPELSAKNPGQKGHDKLEIKSIRMVDAKTVFLETEELKPVDQLLLKFNIDAADGATIKEEMFTTIHKVRPDFKSASK